MDKISLPLHFVARVVSGAGRGKGLGVPTLNLDLRDVPSGLEDGIFACRATVEGKTFLASAHHGLRPTFHDSRSFEVHLIDEVLPTPPGTVEVEVVEFLRGVETFPSAEALTNQMLEDIRATREILL